MGKRWLALGLLAASWFVLPGCAETEPQDPNRVSSIPWNRPEKWEGQGSMGGFMPQGTN